MKSDTSRTKRRAFLTSLLNGLAIHPNAIEVQHKSHEALRNSLELHVMHEDTYVLSKIKYHVLLQLFALNKLCHKSLNLMIEQFFEHLEHIIDILKTCMAFLMT